MYTVLIADQDRPLAAALSEAILQGFQGLLRVESTPQWTFARKRVEEVKPHFLLLGSSLPDMYPSDDLPAVNILSPHTVIILLAPPQNRDLFRQCWDWGVQECLPSPPDPQMVVHILEKYLAAQKKITFSFPMGQTFPYPWDEEKSLTDSLLAKDAQAFQAALESLMKHFEEFAGTPDAAVPAASCLHRISVILLHTIGHRNHSFAEDYPLADLPSLGNSRLTAQLFREWAQSLAEAWFSQATAHRSPLVERALDYIHRNYHQTISLENAAARVMISPQYLSRLFSETMKQSFIEYLTQYRMEKAKELLSRGESIKVVSGDLGYSDPNYFSRLFKKHTGHSPSDFARNLK